MAELATDFSVEQNVLDSLDVELSMLSPKKLEAMRGVARRARDELIARYGAFIPEDKIEENLDIHRRVLVMESGTAKLFFKEWNEDEANGREFVITNNTRAGFFRKGRFIVFNDPYILWDELADEDMRQNWVKDFAEEGLTDKQTREVVSFVTSCWHVIEEVVHAHQDLGEVPIVFQECAADYYRSRIHEELEIPSLVGIPTADLRVEFYKMLLKWYGNDVHKLSFGSKVDESRKMLILRHFTPEVIRKLFPDTEALSNYK